MNTAIKLEKCKCGRRQKYGYQTYRQAGEWVIAGYTFCGKSRWWNLWQHDRTIEHSYQPI